MLVYIPSTATRLSEFVRVTVLASLMRYGDDPALNLIEEVQFLAAGIDDAGLDDLSAQTQTSSSRGISA